MLRKKKEVEKRKVEEHQSKLKLILLKKEYEMEQLVMKKMMLEKLGNEKR